MKGTNNMSEFIIESKPSREAIDKNEALEIKNSLLNNGYLTANEAKSLIEWVIEECRKKLELMSVNLDTDSLDGWCDYFQYMSINFFEQIGLPVTKNRSCDAFGYKFNHYFGTVMFPIISNNGISGKTYLIDGTYKQFFTKERCNISRYNKTRYSSIMRKEISDSPDIGYFVKDKSFAINLINKGYFELNPKTAIKYGEPFYLSSLTREEIKTNDLHKDYLECIMNSSSNYSDSLTDVEDFNIKLEPNRHK